MKKLILILFLAGLKGLAQDDRLFEHTWYLHDLVIDGASNPPPINDEISFVPADFYKNGDLYTGMCEEGGYGILEYIGTDALVVLDIAFLTGGCHQNIPYNGNYSSMYQHFWSLMLGDTPTHYEIIEEEEDENRRLIVTRPNGDYTVFENEAPLSIAEQTSPGFVIYPTFIKTTFNILYSTAIDFQRIVIYNKYGQIVYAANRQQNEIDISNLPAAVYFVSLQTKGRSMGVKRIIKR